MSLIIAYRFVPKLFLKFYCVFNTQNYFKITDQVTANNNCKTPTLHQIHYRSFCY